MEGRGELENCVIQITCDGETDVRPRLESIVESHWQGVGFGTLHHFTVLLEPQLWSGGVARHETDDRV